MNRTAISDHPTASTQARDDFFSFFEQAKKWPLYIILGSQGSGTNLLSRLLQAVFSFSVVHDRSLIFNAAVRALTANKGSSLRREGQHILRSLFPGFWRKRFARRAYYRQASNYVGIHEYFRRATIANPMELAFFFYAYHCWHNGMSHMAIKSDDIWEHITFVRILFPERRYILLVRDLRDNALSIVNKPWGPCDIAMASYYVRQRLQAYVSEIDAFPERSLLVRYETLLTDPQGFVGSFADFTGLPIPDDWRERIDALGVRKQNFNKWKSMPSGALGRCEHILQDFLLRFDYEMATVPRRILSRRERFALGGHALVDIARRIPQRIRRRWSRVFSP